MKSGRGETEPPGPAPAAIGDALGRAAVGDVAHRATTHVFREVPGYSRETVPFSEVEASATRWVTMVAAALESGREPVRAEIEEWLAEVPARRLGQGIPLESGMRAVYTCFQELSAELVSAAAPPGAAVPAAVVAATQLALRWAESSVALLALAYARHTVVEARAIGALKQAFVNHVTAKGPPGAEAEQAAKGLGFDPQGGFQAMATLPAFSAAAAFVDADFEDVEGATIYAVPRSDAVFIMCQGHEAAGVLSRIRRKLPHGPVGIGYARAGLLGARATLGDAALALRVASLRGGGASHFEDDWPFALVLAEAGRLGSMLERARDVAEQQEILAEAVRAFAESEFSLSAAARSLHIHPNTLAYRLERWHVLTGWDPRTGDGLLRSRLFLETLPARGQATAG